LTRSVVLGGRFNPLLAFTIEKFGRLAASGESSLMIDAMSSFRFTPAIDSIK
jgi:hypothetical protein